jgi:hypothetical protein
MRRTIIKIVETNNVADDFFDPSQGAQRVSTNSQEVRPFLLAWLIYVLLIGLIAVRVWVPQGLSERMDFRPMYTAGLLVRTNPASLYDLARQKQVENTFISVRPGVLPFNHLAYEALVFLPFSLLTYRHAYLCMVFFNALLIIPCFFVMRDVFSTPISPWQPRPGFIFFIYLPVTIALAHGQDSILLLFICCLTWHELTHARHFSAGCIVALALFKPHLAILLGFLLSLRYGWRFLAGFAVGGGAVAMTCLSIVSRHGLRSYMEILQATSLAGGQSKVAQSAVGAFPSAMPNLRGLFYATGGQYLSPVVAFSVVAIVSLVLLGSVAYVIRGKTSEGAFALSIVCTVFLSYNIQASDLTILLLPIVLLSGQAYRFFPSCIFALFLLPPLLLLFSPQGNLGDNFYLLSLPILAITILIARTQPTLNVANA